MPPTRRPRIPTTSDPRFEDHVTAILDDQNRVLERLENKLNAPVLNGGFDKLVTKVERIELVTEQLKDAQSVAGEKIDLIHAAVYDPDKGLYAKVKDHSEWIENVSKFGKWFIGLVIAGVMAGIGKLLYEFIVGHIHYTP